MAVNQPQQHARFTPALPVRDEVEHRNGRNRNNQHNQRGGSKAQTKFLHQDIPNRPAGYAHLRADSLSLFFNVRNVNPNVAGVFILLFAGKRASCTSS